MVSAYVFCYSICVNQKEPTMIDLLIDTHLSLERQGPGSTEATEMALSFIKGLGETSQIADLGCGTGGEARKGVYAPADGAARQHAV